jgi:hypothetical protein
LRKKYVDVNDTASDCAGVSGVMRVSADSVGPFPLHATFAELRNICPQAVKDYYRGVGGWQPPALYFHAPGVAIAAVDTFYDSYDSPIGPEHVPGLWTFVGDSILLPGGHLFPKTAGELRHAYPRGTLTSAKGDDMDGVTAQVCALPSLTFQFGYDEPTPKAMGEWSLSARAISDSARIFFAELEPRLPPRDSICVGVPTY